MKIIYVISTLGAGGAESQLCSFAIEWKRIYPEIPIEICALKSGGVFEKRLSENGISYTIINSSNVLKSIYHLRKLVQKEKADIVHAHMLFADIVSRLATFGLKSKLVVTHHGLGKWKKKWLLILDKITKHYVDHFIMVSEQSYDIRKKREKYPTKKMSVVYNGISKHFLTEDIRKIPSSGERIIAGTIARMTNNKQINLMIDVIKDLEKYQNLFYEVIGEGDNFENIRKQVDELSLQSRVRFWGWVDNERVNEITKDWTFFCLPSVNEDLPVSMLECMAQRIVPIASSVGGIITLLDHGKNGMLCNSKNSKTFTDAIEYLMNNPETYAQMSQNCYQIVKEKFLIEEAVRKYMEIYRKLGVK